MESSGTSDDLSESMSMLPRLPIEIVDYIIGCLPPHQIVGSRWFHLGRGFKRILEHHMRRSNTVNACEADLKEFFQRTLNHDISDFPEEKRFLELLIFRLLNHIKNFSVPIGLLSHIVTCFETSAGQLSLRNLSELSIFIGEGNGMLTSTKHFDRLNAAGFIFGGKCLDTINLDVTISENEAVTVCGFRELIRFLQASSNDKTKWNLRLMDCTTLGQGWFGPTDLSKSRNKAFICYVRALLDLGISLNKLALCDNCKTSPYMLVMVSCKRRSIYMYHDFKNCKELQICYDVGLIAPAFAHEGEIYTSLERVEVHASHVLYKSDFLVFLSNAPGLSEIRVILPANWSRRVSSCRLGCFQNPDFACFREEGWCAFHEKLNVNMTFVEVEKLAQGDCRRHC